MPFLIRYLGCQTRVVDISSKLLPQVQLDGNLFRVPRPAVLLQGTQAVMAYLRDKIPK